MIAPTVVFMVSAFVIVLIAIYLTVTKCYRTGFLGSVGFLFTVLGFGSMLLEFVGGTEFKVLPQVAMGMAGMALFLVQHFFRSRLFRRKREHTLGMRERRASFSKG